MLAGNAKRIFCDNVTVICMAPRVPTAGLCPRILFRMVTRSLGCFCRALGCCVRRLTTLAISAFIFPCPKILYARDSFRHFPLATHCTACTQNHWSCNPRQAAPQKAIQGSMRNMQGTMRICWLFGLPSTQKLCTNQPHVLCPCSNLSAWRDPFSSKTLSVESQATNGKKSHLLILASSFAADLHELSRWPQHYENDVTAWSFQTLAFAMIWNCWNRAPLLKCSDTVCLSIIKTSKRSGISETCTTCMSLRGLTFHDPLPRWNHRSSTCLSNTLALNFPEYYPIVCISATFSNIHVVYELTEAPMSWATLLPSQLKLKSLEGDSRW